MTIYTTGQTRLYKQVVADLILDEGYRRFAYADPLSQLYKQLRNKSQWFTSLSRGITVPILFICSQYLSTAALNLVSWVS